MSEGLIHLIDDDDAIRQSLGFLLETADFDVRTYPSGPAFLAAVDKGLEPGCIVTDVRMPDMSGLELIRRLNALGSGLPVIVITGHGDVPLAVEAMRAGVVDFLEKPFADESLLASVRTALATGARAAQRDADRRRFEAMLETLSPRERDVLRGVLDGKPNKVIAYELGISPRTVEVYRANVMTKTGAGGLSELVRMALLADF